MKLTTYLLLAPLVTLAMTLFSYLISFIRGKEFREPELLTVLIYRYFEMPPLRGLANLPGWILHLVIGYLFLALYNGFFFLNEIEPTPGFTLMVGFALGVLGILGWKVIFTLHPNPPDIKFTEFYIQLLMAHIIFAFTASMGF
ncbi:MAG: hypothetical protein CMC08_00140 [Flavobacteriaceae bacterium]|nr:hypothetical protein [Flavobacteriaceae bacterium]